MIIYSVIILMLVYGIYNYDIKQRRGGNTLFGVVLIILIFMAGLQDGMGGDNLSYSDYYDDVPTWDNLDINDLSIGIRFQPLWYISISLLKSISNSYTFFHICHAFVVNTIILFFIKKNTQYVFSTILLFFITFNYLYFNIEIQRESLAICVFLLSIPSLVKKRYGIYIIYCVIAFLFHVSAFFMVFIPMANLIMQKVKKRRTVLLWIILFMGSTMLIPSFVNSLFFDSTDVSRGVAQQAKSYMDITTNFSSVLIAGLFNVLTYVLVMYVYMKSKLKVNFFFVCLILTITITFGNIFIPILYRLNNYMLIPTYIALMSATYASCAQKRLKHIVIVSYLMMLVSLVHFYTVPATFLGPEKKLYEMYIPYRSILD